MFAGIPMSTAHTGRAQEARILALGLGLHRAAPKRDIDTIDDLDAVAAGLPLAAARPARVGPRRLAPSPREVVA